MKLLLGLTAMTVIGLFGIIGTVEYAEALHNSQNDQKAHVIYRS